MKDKKIPMRRCAGCMTSQKKSELIRIVYNKNDELVIDAQGNCQGRGVYLCKKKECILLAKKKRAINRSLRSEIPGEMLDNIFETLMEYAETK